LASRLNGSLTAGEGQGARCYRWGLVKHGVIVAAAGRRIDPEDAPVSRFPLESVEQTRQRIKDTLVRRGATALVSSAACGADLLALSAAADLNLRRRVVLPFEPERFRETSVIDRPGNWAPVFDETVRQLQATGDVIVLDEAPGDAAYEAVGEAILSEAARLAGEDGHRSVAMVIWDGRVRPGVDLTAEFRNSAARRGFEIVEVLTFGAANGRS
jgi:hypothetical protein